MNMEDFTEEAMAEDLGSAICLLEVVQRLVQSELDDGCHSISAQTHLSHDQYWSTVSDSISDLLAKYAVIRHNEIQ